MSSGKKAFPNMVQFLKERETEHFRLEYFDVTEEDLRRCSMLDAVQGRCEYRGLTVGKYVRLRRNNGFSNVMMSDTWMEKRSNYGFFLNARGDVLIAGLGIGMVLMGIQNKPEVTSVIVIEKEQEIIDLVAKQLPLNSKVTIIHADIFEYQTKQKFDCIYFDIWDNVCSDNWTEMKKLHAKFKSRKKPDAWISSWKKEETQDLHRRDY